MLTADPKDTKSTCQTNHSVQHGRFVLVAVGEYVVGIGDEARALTTSPMRRKRK